MRVQFKKKENHARRKRINRPTEIEDELLLQKTTPKRSRRVSSTRLNTLTSTLPSPTTDHPLLLFTIHIIRIVTPISQPISMSCIYFFTQRPCFRSLKNEINSFFSPLTQGSVNISNDCFSSTGQRWTKRAPTIVTTTDDTQWKIKTTWFERAIIFFL